MNKPTYEEFESAVRKRYRELCSDKDYNDFYLKEEKKGTVRDEYENNLYAVDHGWATYETMMNGGVNGCAYNLMMLTE